MSLVARCVAHCPRLVSRALPKISVESAIVPAAIIAATKMIQRNKHTWGYTIQRNKHTWGYNIQRNKHTWDTTYNATSTPGDTTYNATSTPGDTTCNATSTPGDTTYRRLVPTAIIPPQNTQTIQRQSLQHLNRAFPAVSEPTLAVLCSTTYYSTLQAQRNDADGSQR